MLNLFPTLFGRGNFQHKNTIVFDTWLAWPIRPWTPWPDPGRAANEAIVPNTHLTGQGKAWLAWPRQKRPRQLLAIRQRIFDFGPKSAPKPDDTKPKVPGAVPTNQRQPNPIDFGPVS
jgi:hypothetical protein